MVDTVIPHSRLRAAAPALGAALLLTCVPADAAPTEPWRARVSPVLQSLHDSQQRNRVQPSRAHLDAQGRVEADVHVECGSPAPAGALAQAGFVAGSHTRLPPLCVVEGWVSPAALPALAGIPGVTRITVPTYVHRPVRPVAHAGTSTGAINGNALTIMHVDELLARAGGGGRGVRVGVQSHGVASLQLIQSRGELPGNVVDYTRQAGGTPSPYEDEGTMLLEQVHAVAPDAQLAFCDPGTFVQYTACLQQFAQAGATVVADDILFLDQDPMSSAGPDTTAIEQFLAANPQIAMFTSAGNDYGSYWQGTYNPVALSALGGSLPDMSAKGCATDNAFVNQLGAGQVQVLQTTTSNGIYVPLTFAWSDPPGTPTSRFDIYWLNSTPAYSGCISTANATEPSISQSIAVYPGDNVIVIASRDLSVGGKFLKLWVGGDGLTTLSVPTVGSVVSPQSFASGVMSIGAVDGSDGIGDNIEKFSSRGPVTVLYPEPATIQAPAFVAPDGIRVDAAGTQFAGNLFPDGNFYGTSAAVPNAAAVAALLRSAFPSLTVPQLRDAMERGAVQLGSGVWDGTFGAGRIDVMGSVALFPAPTLTALTDVAIDAQTSTTSSAVPFSVTSAGPLHFVVKSSNPTLIPEQVGSGTPGISVTPADCGTGTLTCSLTVTAAPYQGGTATLTVSAVDGGGRAAPATMQVTVTNPQPAPPSTGGGGALALWDLVFLCVLLLRRSSTRP